MRRWQHLLGKSTEMITVAFGRHSVTKIKKQFGQTSDSRGKSAIKIIRTWHHLLDTCLLYLLK
jgi:hypothetical protein